jgi:homoserine O-acetyltransferase
VLWAWHDADPSRSRHGGRLADALEQVSARCVIMPSTTDAYFTLDEARIEYDSLTNADWRPLASPYGHCAGAPGRFAKEHTAVDQAIRQLLNCP